MCGIFGLVGKRSPEVKRALAQGTRAMAHRGPDDEGIEILALRSDAEQCVGLGSRRLAILDLSPAGHMPMHDPETGNWLVFNGEIFNFQQVRSELEKVGHRFISTGDTEVLLKAYGEWGEGCLGRLAGMFAFALWDARRERLFLARDRLGVKPLYYYESHSLFLFGSEIRALLASGLVPRRLDMTGLASYLAFGAVQDPLTIIEGVRSLPPGHTLVWEKDHFEASSYWSLAEVASRPPATDAPGEAVAAIRGLIRQAVSERLISDVPIGVFLSGGVDSSCIVAAASEPSQKPLETFSVVFGQSEFCEARYSDRVAREHGCHHHKIELTETRLLQEIPDALGAMDQPSVDGINTYIISRATKEAGVTVALSGLGGDEIFAGYSTFRSVPKMMSFQRYAGWLAPLGRGFNALLGGSETNTLSKVLALAGNDYYGNQPYFLSRALFLPRTVRALLRRQVDENGNHMAACNWGELVEQVRELDPINQVSVFEGSTYMANTLLRDTDCMSMAVSLEARTPYLDHRLWEYVLPLPGRLKLDPPTPKPLLLRSVGQRLPREIYLRRKMGFTLPFERWLRDGLRGEVEGGLLSRRDAAQCPLEQKAVEKVWHAFLAGKTSWSRPWALYVLKQWIRRNIRESP
ncbi:MAG: asparagine synthase (glutamine-hydrolyzing) [Terriglobia bacterium]|jgi:asparagine synthase (glutamine-hydrolysing)